MVRRLNSTTGLAVFTHEEDDTRRDRALQESTAMLALQPPLLIRKWVLVTYESSHRPSVALIGMTQLSVRPLYIQKRLPDLHNF